MTGWPQHRLFTEMAGDVLCIHSLGYLYTLSRIKMNFRVWPTLTFCTFSFSDEDTNETMGGLTLCIILLKEGWKSCFSSGRLNLTLGTNICAHFASLFPLYNLQRRVGLALFNEYECKNAQQNISKLNPTIHKKDHTIGSSWIPSRVVRMV